MLVTQETKSEITEDQITYQATTPWYSDIHSFCPTLVGFWTGLRTRTNPWCSVLNTVTTSNKYINTNHQRYYVNPT